jgi:hypothetical protein
MSGGWFSIVAENVRAWRILWTKQRTIVAFANTACWVAPWQDDGPVRKGGYFSELLMEVNLLLSLEPMPFTTLMIASEIPAAIKPYSMAVAPVSSRKNLMNNRMESP